MKRFKEFLELLVEASEGDARKYMKKVLIDMGFENMLRNNYSEHWSEEVFNDIRDDFIHKGCDIYFTPGIARIAYGELYYGTANEDSFKVDQLCQLVKFVTMAHKPEFSRNLEHITVVQEGPNKGQKQKSKPFTFDDLQSMFSSSRNAMRDIERANFEKTKHTPNGYTVIELTDYETAHKYLPYTDLPGGDAWCYLEDSRAFDYYKRSGNRTYLALAPGFEKLKPGDKGYGRSMIGFDMGPVEKNGYSELKVCNNRYNHAKDLEHENSKSGDAKYNERELSEILGIAVWKEFLGYTEQELLDKGIMSEAHAKAILAKYEAGFKETLAHDDEQLLNFYIAKCAKEGLVMHALGSNAITTFGDWRILKQSAASKTGVAILKYCLAYNVKTKAFIKPNGLFIRYNTLVMLLTDSINVIYKNKDVIKCKAYTECILEKTTVFKLKLESGKAVLFDTVTGEYVSEMHDDIASTREELNYYNINIRSNINMFVCVDNNKFTALYAEQNGSRVVKVLNEFTDIICLDTKIYTIENKYGTDLAQTIKYYRNALEGYTDSIKFVVLNGDKIEGMYLVYDNMIKISTAILQTAIDRKLNIESVDTNVYSNAQYARLTNGSLIDKTGKVVCNNIAYVFNSDKSKLMLAIQRVARDNGIQREKIINLSTMQYVANGVEFDEISDASPVEYADKYLIIDRYGMSDDTHNILINKNGQYELGLKDWSDRIRVYGYGSSVEFIYRDKPPITYDAKYNQFVDEEGNLLNDA